MANLSAPDKTAGGNTTWLVPDEDMYECYVLDVEEVPNAFYDPKVDNESKKMRLKWTLQIQDDELEDAPEGSRYSSRMSYFTGTALGWHAKNKLVGFLRDAFKDFEYDPAANDGKGYMTSFEDVEDLKRKVVGSTLRVMTTNTTKTYEDGDKTFVNVKAIAKSKRPKLSAAEVAVKQMGATGTDDDIPF